MAKSPLQVIRLKPRSQELRDLICTGRIELSQFCLGAGVEFTHFNVYGWDGAHENYVAAGRTDALFAAIRAECEHRRSTPIMISGDVNADTNDIETLQEMLNAEGWTDVGAHGHRWGARKNEPTCWAPNSGLSGTRRDYIIVNAMLLPFVMGFGVCPLDEMPTHAMLQVLLRKPADDYATTRAIKPGSLSGHFEGKLKANMEEQHLTEGEEPIQQTNKEKAACRPQLLQKLHDNMDRVIAQNEDAIDHDTAHWHTKAAWRNIAKCIELGFIDALELDDIAAKKLKGHGKPKYDTAVPDPIDDEEVEKLTIEGRKARRATLQARRCQQIADRIKRNHGKPTAKDMLLDPSKRERIAAENDRINHLTCAKLI